MASTLISRAPQCLSCVRRAMGNLGEKHLFPAGQQVRGKKKTSKTPNKVNALLLKDIKGYGKQGNVVSVVAGVMRNQWYPQRKAEYATVARMNELGLKQEDVIEGGLLPANEDVIPNDAAKEDAKRVVQAERNVPKPEGYVPFLRPTKAEKIEKKVTQPAPEPEPELPTPVKAAAIISKVFPENEKIVFVRTALTTAPAIPKRMSPSLPAKAAVSIAAGGKTSIKPLQTGIYGSVSTTDIALHLNSSLANHEKGSLIRISAEEITFVDELEDPSRVKHLGDFKIDIKLQDSPNTVRRTIRVKSED